MATSPIMTMLDHRVPITLLCDLVSLSDPDSAAINCAERPDQDTIWLDAAESHAARVHAASA